MCEVFRRVAIRNSEQPILQLLSIRLNRSQEREAREYFGDLNARKAVQKLEALRAQIGEQQSRLFALAETIDAGASLRRRWEILRDQHPIFPTPAVKRNLSALDKEVKKAEGAHAELTAKTAAMRRLLFISEVYFSQRQVLQIQARRRYKRLPPRILANAIAGLPYMGYRTSADKCAKFEPKSERQQFEIFKLIAQWAEQKGERVFTEKLKITVRELKKWIQSLQEGSGAASEIKSNKLILIRAVKRVSKRHLRGPDALAFATYRLFCFLKKHINAEQALLRDVKSFLLAASKNNKSSRQ